ncbi:MAG TPA: response regulator [Longimicrobiales bacterium]
MKPLRLLLVEDNPDDALLVLREIRRGGYEVEHVRVEGAEDMLRALDTGKWDLIVSDFSLPSFDAPAAVRTLKSTQLDIPIIIVSGTVGEDTAVAALKAGAHDFLSKGNLNRLVPAIDRELREAASRRDRRIAQARLRESEEALSAIFGASPLPIISVDVRGCITAWNHAAEGTFGWSEQEALGQHASILGQSAHRNLLGEVLRGETVVRAEIKGQRRDGGKLVMLVSASPLHGPDSQVTGAVAIINDITEQRALEEQLRQAQKMEAVGRLAGGIAHDFNNILTAIQGYGTLLQEELPADSPHRADVDGILDATTRAASFTRQLLAFSRKQVTQPEHLEPNELISGLQRMLSRLIGTGYTLDFQPGDDSPPIFADRGQISQVIMNLVVNARDSMPGGGTIRIETSRAAGPPKDYIRGEGRIANGPYSVISVRDTGHGIPPEIQELIFEPFFTTKDASKGTGLGLSTVYGIVVQHGGVLCLDSGPDGTEFRLHIPESRVVTERRPLHSLPARGTTGGATIVLVEDDAGIRNLVQRALLRRGFRVHAASNAEEGLELIRNHPETDVLITDLMLEGMTGAELVTAVAEISPGIRSVLVSGYSATDLALSPDASFIQKPFSPDEVIAAVRRLLEH